MKIILSENMNISKLSEEEIKLLKEAGLWDSVKQVGQGIGQAAKGAWNVGAGTVGAITSIVQGIRNQIQQMRGQAKQQSQKGQVDNNYVSQLQQLATEINTALQEAKEEMAAIQTKQNANEQLQNLPAAR